MENLENFGFPLSGQAKLLITSVKKNKSEIKNILLSFLIHQVSISSYCFLLWLSKINEPSPTSVLYTWYSPWR